MVVGDNESSATKNTGESLVQCRVHRLIEHIKGFAQIHWMPPSVDCLRRIAPAAAMVDKFE